jgi:hypothetical protein
MRFLVAVAIATLHLMAPSARSQEANEAPDANIGDIMGYQQVRHAKLWFAGHGGNWPLAEYEIEKLKDGFDEMNRLIGGDTIKQAVGDPIAALEKAVDAKNGDAFARGFDQLTAGCNGCHRLLDHAFIVIQRPTAVPFSNQSFAPQK